MPTATKRRSLFFVAASRARTHLRLYLARQQRTAMTERHRRTLRWEPWTPPEEVFVRRRCPFLPDAPVLVLVLIAWLNGWVRHQHEAPIVRAMSTALLLHHVLGLGGAQKSTAFTRTHDCLYEFMQWLSAARLGGDIGEAVAMCEFERIWQASGPADHAFAADYRRLADRLVRALVRLGAGQRFRKAEPLAIDFPNGRVLVQPEEMTELPNGTVVLRRVRTGYKRRTSMTGWITRLPPCGARPVRGRLCGGGAPPDG